MMTTPSAPPDETMVVRVERVEGSWAGRELAGGGVLRVAADTLALEVGGAERVRMAWADLSGAAWRTGSLAMYAEQGNALLYADRDLERAWVAIVRLACPVPEFTRALRVLGSRRGGDATVQAMFFAPLLQARRSLEGEGDLARRVGAFDAGMLRTRMLQAVDSLASANYPASAPDCRALTAELREAAEPLFAALDALEAATADFRGAGEERHFTAWRRWAAAVHDVFAGADSGWSRAVPLLPPPPVPRQPGRGTRARGHR